MTILHKTTQSIRLKRGLRADLEKIANYFGHAEPIYTTDTKQLFIADASHVPQPIQTLNGALCINNEVLCLDNEVVFVF
jgi:hypothetical protein